MQRSPTCILAEVVLKQLPKRGPHELAPNNEAFNIDRCGRDTIITLHSTATMGNPSFELSEEFADGDLYLLVRAPCLSRR